VLVKVALTASPWNIQDNDCVKWKDAQEKSLIDQFIVSRILGRGDVTSRNVTSLPRAGQGSALVMVGGGAAKSTVVSGLRETDGFVLLMEGVKGVRLGHALG
jgi:hypothetical protein